MLRSSNWLGHSPFTGELTGSSPVRSTQASKALQAMRLTCNQDNSVRFRMEALTNSLRL